MNLLNSLGINYAINFKNLTEFSKDYSVGVGSSLFHYVDITTHADFNQYTMRQVGHVRNDANNARDVVDDVKEITLKDLQRERRLSLLVLMQAIM